MKMIYLFEFNDIDDNEYCDNYATGVHLPPFKYRRNTSLHHQNNLMSQESSYI